MNRENKAMKDILAARNPDKKIQVSMWNPDKDETIIKEREKTAKEKTDRDEKSEILRAARMPMFCPECKHIMNKTADKKFFNLTGKCMDCVVTEENRHRIDGTWDVYEKTKVLQNKRSWINEQIASIVEWRKGEEVKFLNQINPDGHSVEEEKWETNKAQIEMLADKATKEYNEMLDSVNSELSEL